MTLALPFLIISTLIAIVSMRLNYKASGQTLRADQAFWAAWLVLIWSAETVTSFAFFAPYDGWPVHPDTRKMTLLIFAAAAGGFYVGSLAYTSAKTDGPPIESERKVALFAMRWRNIIAALILLVATYEYVTVGSRFSDLRDLRLAAVNGEIERGILYTQFFLFAQACIMLLGYADGFFGRFSKLAFFAGVGGLVIHNLAFGGRINLVVSPALYVIPFVLAASKRPDWRGRIRANAYRSVFVLASVIAVLFSAVQVARSLNSNFYSILTFEGFIRDTIFALPMYVSDTFISVKIHAAHAYESKMPFGFYTFDGFYRASAFLFETNYQDPNTVFGHAYYRHTPAPWAWTQTNLIPRLISDFGSAYWTALIPICAVAQWISIHRFKVAFIGVCLQSLMVYSSAYSILGAPWFTSFNLYILIYASILYVMAHSGGRDLTFSRHRVRTTKSPELLK